MWQCCRLPGASTGTRTRFEHFASLHDFDATLRNAAPESGNRHFITLSYSRRITLFECPKLSEHFSALVGPDHVKPNAGSSPESALEVAVRREERCSCHIG